MKIKGIQEVEITREELAEALRQFIIENYTGEFDDAGCDWVTTKDGKFCIGYEKDWVISKDPRVATLVDAVNIIMYGQKMTID